MPDIARTPALADHELAGLLGRPARAAAIAVRAHPARFDHAGLGIGQGKFERAGERIGLCQSQLQTVAGGIGGAAVAPHQRLGCFVMAEILVAERRDRNKAVPAKTNDGGEEAEALHPGDARVEHLADAGREPCRDIAIDGVALGLHRAPFGLADRVADLLQARPVAI